MSTAGQPLVSVIMLSYARPALIREALRSVVEQSYANLEILVVDNRSALSGEIAGIVAGYPAARLIANSQNLGFTGAMNLGIHSASGHYIFLTEDDMVLERDCVRELVEYAGANPGNSLLSGLIYNQGNGSIWAAGGNVTLGPVFKMTIFGFNERDLGQFPAPFDVNYISGSMVFAPAALLRSLGGFREDFFMYYEDIELCMRVHESGGRITVVPSAQASHFEPVKTAASDHISFHKFKNFFAVYILHAPARVWFSLFLRYAVLGTLRSLITQPGSAWLRLKALLFTCSRFPQLWRARRAGRLRAGCQSIREARVA